MIQIKKTLLGLLNRFSVLPDQGSDAGSPPSILIRKRYWVAMLAVAVAEWMIPLRWWIHGPLTAVALISFPFLLSQVLSILREAFAAEGARISRRFWGWIVLLSSVFVISEMAKLWLLKELFGGQSPSDLRVGFRSYVLVALIASVSILWMRPKPIQRLLLRVADDTARLAALSFGGAILCGAFLLMLPLSVRNASDISGVDALFTSASAVCVTGLAVNHIPTTYTFFGQMVLLLLIQIGGFGIMLLYGAAAALAGRRMSTRSARMMSELIDVASLSSIRRLLWGIVGFTLVVEGLGAVLLYFTLLPFPDAALGAGANSPMAGAGSIWWAAVFHSVSAYCNAGFSLFRDGITPFAGYWSVSLTLMFLVFGGGLGFPVWFELFGNLGRRILRRRPERISLHSRVVLSMSAFLLVLGTLLFLALEWKRSMSGLPVHVKMLTAAFQSVIARTAGFNTLDFSQMAHATWLSTCVLMFIGASPGSTGGGIKTTTFAVLAAATRADLTGLHRVELWRRSIANDAVRRAVGVTLISGAAVVFTTFLLMLTEPFEPLRLGFEAVSALATVGLSTGITAELSNAGKLILTVAMFLGRIGPLTLALALTTHKISRSVALPEERIGIG